MKVKTDYSQCAYITAGKVYGVEFYSDGDLAIVDDENEVIWIDIGEGGCPHLRGNNWVVVSDEKPFDITQHEWSDEKLSFSGGTFDVDFGHCTNSDDSVSEVVNLDFNKADAIAIAKHFKLTAEDLK